MIGAVKLQFDESMDAFVNLAQPLLLNHFNGGIMHPIHDYDEFRLQLLDTHAGIDILHELPNNQGVRGIAMRMQKGYFTTFTIRYKLATSSGITEYEKRLRAIVNDDILKPCYTVQGYYDAKNYNLLAMAYIKTRDLITAIANDSCQKKIKSNGGDGNLFYVVDWYDLLFAGFDVKIITA
jgi:hypothetical protein